VSSAIDYYCSSIIDFLTRWFDSECEEFCDTLRSRHGHEAKSKSYPCAVMIGSEPEFDKGPSYERAGDRERTAMCLCHMRTPL